jgi:hypothetical protein
MLPLERFFQENPELAYLVLFLAAVPLVLLSLAFPYAVLRLRDAHSKEPDPHLGFKAAQGYFFSLAVLLVLTGLTLIAVDVLLPLGVPGSARPEFPSPCQRTGAALIVAGGLFTLIHGLLGLTLRDPQGPSPVRRVFLGCRFAVHGVVLMVTLTALLVMLFQRRDGLHESGAVTQARNFFLGVLLVWGPSWLVHLILFRLASVPPYPGPRETEWTPETDWEPERDHPRSRRD